MEAPFHVASHLPAGFLSLFNIVVSGFQRETRKKAPVFKYFLCLWFASKQVTCPNPDPRPMKRNSFYILMEQLQVTLQRDMIKGGEDCVAIFTNGLRYPEKDWICFNPEGSHLLFSHRPFVGTSHMTHRPQGGWKVKASVWLGVAFVSNDKVIPCSFFLNKIHLGLWKLVLF